MSDKEADEKEQKEKQENKNKEQEKDKKKNDEMAGVVFQKKVVDEGGDQSA